MANRTHSERSLSLRRSLSFTADDDVRDAAPLDNELQPDPELAEGPASGGRIALFAVGIAVILGAVFYGLNNSSIDQASTSSTAQNTASRRPRKTPRNQPRRQPRLRACVT